MQPTEADILKLAGSKPIVDYHDFKALQSTNKPDDSYYLFRVKDVLKDNGYTCHEKKDRMNWKRCGYNEPHTHFHRP